MNDTFDIERFTISRLAFIHAELEPALADAASITLLIRMPAASATFYGAVLSVLARASGVCAITLFEAPTVSDTGLSRTPECLNRLDTPPACPVAVSLGPTVTDDGTKLVDGVVGTADGEWLSGPFIGKPATDYLVRLTNVSGDPVIATLDLTLGVIPNHDYLYAPRCNTGATPGGRRAKAQG